MRSIVRPGSRAARAGRGNSGPVRSYRKAMLVRSPALQTACAALCLLAVAMTAHAQGGIFDIGDRPAARAVVTIGDGAVALDQHESDMTRLLRGVLADLRAKDLAALRACVPPNPFLGDPTGAERIGVVHLFPEARPGGSGAAPEPAKRVEIVRTPDQSFIAVELVESGAQPARAELSKEATRDLLMHWPQYRGGFGEDACADPRAEVFELPRPYVPGWFSMDKPTMGQRFVGRSTTDIDATDRNLTNEVLFARLPRGYDPRTPAGLLIWVNAGDDGRPPEVFSHALDELGIICVGASNSGNVRHVASRYQLAFDGLATASRRWHIDPARVYVTGISGGGRVSSILIGCFPDVFAGAVPIVGMSYCEKVPTGTGQFWRAGYNRPAAPLFRLLRQRPIAAVTGRKDFNYLEMTHAADLMRRDGLQVKIFGDPDMGHELPSPARFIEALQWADHVHRRAGEAQAAAATKALDACLQRFGDGAPANDAARRMVAKVTEAGPWTDAAWRAVELLGR